MHRRTTESTKHTDLFDVLVIVLTLYMSCATKHTHIHFSIILLARIEVTPNVFAVRCCLLQTPSLQ